MPDPTPPPPPSEHERHHRTHAATTQRFTVDRSEGDVVVLETEAGDTLSVRRADLAPAVARGVELRDGACLVVAVDDTGKPDWATAEADPAEEARRREAAAAQRAALGASDPGGDLAL